MPSKPALKPPTRSAKNRLSQLVLIVLIGLSLFWRWQKIDWGEGEWYHPDENNLARSLVNLNPTNLDPNFFAYGPLPGYLVFYSLKLFGFLYKSGLSFPQAIIGLRIFSAICASVSLLAVYRLARYHLPHLPSLSLTALVGLIPGLIQAAHFGTTESALGLFLLLAGWLTIELWKTPPPLIGSLAGLLLGVIFGTKISGLVILFPFFFALLANKQSIRQKIKTGLLVLVVGLLSSSAFAPFQWRRFGDFWQTIQYEGGIAQGTNRVFYTRQFENSLPLIFPLTKIFPLALGPGLTLVFLTSLPFLIKLKKGSPTFALWLVAASWLLPNLFFFSQWTRFYIPVFPLLGLLGGLFLFKIRSKPSRRLALGLLLASQLLASLAFTRIYRTPDSRLQANDWLNENLPPNSVVLTEPRNVARLPTNPQLQVIEADLYNLDHDVTGMMDHFLSQDLARADYLLVPSRRIFANHSAQTYPQTHCYYQLLFSGQLGFKPLTTFASYPTLLGLSFPDEQAEETWSVFDHPVVRAYEKTDPFSKDEYLRLLNQCAQNI